MEYQMFDKQGNRLVMETGRPFKLRLFLKGKRPKLIAHYDYDKKTLIVKKNSERHYHYKTKSYGFNYALFDNLDIDYVHLTIDKEIFNIPADAFNQARVMNFSGEGFELQKFLPVEIIRKYALQSV
jgi:hypothetical protein